MGDRSNVQFRAAPRDDGDELGQRRDAGVINLYSHWYGGDLFVAVQAALDSPAARSRWSDPSFCTRVVVQRTLELCGARGDDDGTGFGLWFGPDDNEHEIMTVAFNGRDGGTVTLGAGVWDFEMFCSVEPDVIRALAG